MLKCLIIVIKILKEILEFELTEDSKYIIMASDGVWEFIDNRKAMNIVFPFYTKNDADGACHILTKEATEEWKRVTYK